MADIFSVGVALLVFLIFLVSHFLNWSVEMAHLAKERSGESICTLVPALDYRRLDTGIIRAVYEGGVAYSPRRHPLRPDDDLSGPCGIADEELDEFTLELAQSCGRSDDWSDWEKNPLFGQVGTYSDLIEFLCAQPKARGA